MAEFKYEEHTAGFYRGAKALAYQRRYSGGGNGNFRQRFIAGRERSAVSKLLKGLAVRSALDIPAGTGKLAPILVGKYALEATIADISPDMLALAEQAYRAEGAGRGEIRSVVCDAARIRESIPSARFGAVVCLRLMHRVPSKMRGDMLRELSQVADYTIVSFALSSPLQRARRFLLVRMSSKDRVHLNEPVSRRQVLRELGHEFTILRKKAIFPGLSAEYVFLVRPRKGKWRHR
jgi:ubiquinone/menaquinone biosynthesis C-methylase UbiE